MEKNNDTLITFGEEALTMRKDDPRTQEHKKKVLKKMEENRKIYEDAKSNPFKGVNLSNARGEDETFEEYRKRLKLNKMLQKQYNKVGRDKFLEMYPAGVQYAIDQAKDQIDQNNKSQQLVAKGTLEDGTEIPVVINNNKK